MTCNSNWMNDPSRIYSCMLGSYSPYKGIGISHCLITLAIAAISIMLIRFSVFKESFLGGGGLYLELPLQWNRLRLVLRSYACTLRSKEVPHFSAGKAGLGQVAGQRPVNCQGAWAWETVLGFPILWQGKRRALAAGLGEANPSANEQIRGIYKNCTLWLGYGHVLGRWMCWIYGWEGNTKASSPWSPSPQKTGPHQQSSRALLAFYTVPLVTLAPGSMPS